MLKPGRVTKVKVLFLVLVFVFNFDVFKFSAAIFEKGLLDDRAVRVRFVYHECDYRLQNWTVQCPVTN